MVFFSPTKNRSHLLSHHIPEVLIHISCSFRADADAPHAADALFRIRYLWILGINGCNRALLCAQPASGTRLIAERFQRRTSELLIGPVASFQYQWTGVVFIKSFLDLTCHLDEFGLILLVRTAGSKLSEDGMLRNGCKSRYAAESLLFESILKLSQCIFPGTVAIDAVKYCLSPVTC